MAVFKTAALNHSATPPELALSPFPVLPSSHVAISLAKGRNSPIKLALPGPICSFWLAFAHEEGRTIIELTGVYTHILTVLAWAFLLSYVLYGLIIFLVPPQESPVLQQSQTVLWIFGAVALLNLFTILPVYRALLRQPRKIYAVNRQPQLLLKAHQAAHLVAFARLEFIALLALSVFSSSVVGTGSGTLTALRWSPCWRFGLLGKRWFLFSKEKCSPLKFRRFTYTEVASGRFGVASGQAAPAAGGSGPQSNKTSGRTRGCPALKVELRLQEKANLGGWAIPSLRSLTRVGSNPEGDEESSPSLTIFVAFQTT